MNTLIKTILLLTSFFTLSFAHAEIYKWVDANGKTHFSDKDPRFSSAKPIEASNPIIEPKQPTSKVRLKDIKFEDAALASCIRDAAGKNGYDAVFANEIKDLTCNNIGSLTGIENLSSLWQLILVKTEIKDLTPVSTLKNLRMLIIEGSQIDDVSPLSNLSNLPQLVLTKAHIESVEPLRNLSGLIHLDLSNNRIKSVVALEKQTQLITLGLEGNPLNCTQVVDLYVKLIAGQENTKPIYTSIYPACEQELSARKPDILAAEKSIQEKLTHQPNITSQQKEQSNTDRSVQELVSKRDTKGLSSWLAKNQNAFTDFKINGMPLFNLAVQYYLNQPNNDDDFQFLEWLLKHGAKTNSKDTNERIALTYLYDSVQLNTKNKPLLKFLLKHGTDINYAPPNRPTVLVVAAAEGKLDWVKELIALGANINGQDGFGRTALMMSYGNQFYQVFDYLLNAGANIQLRDQNGAALIHFVAWQLNSRPNDERSGKAKHYAVMLLERKLKFDLNNKYDREAYQKCVRYLPIYFQHIKPEQLIKRET